MKANLRLVVGLAAACAALPSPAFAGGVPVIDPTAIARIRETVSVATKTLGAVQQQVQQVTQMRNTIGQIGQGRVGDMLSQAGISFSDLNGIKGALSDVKSIGSQVGNMTDQMKQLKLPGESMSFGNITSLASGREAAAQLFFFNGSGEMTQDTVAKLRERRNILVRDAAINGFGAATAMKGDMTRTQEIGDKLAVQAKSASDLRADVQANTATLLAIYGEISKQTALQAQMLEIQASQTLSVDATGKRGK